MDTNTLSRLKAAQAAAATSIRQMVNILDEVKDKSNYANLIVNTVDALSIMLNLHSELRRLTINEARGYELDSRSAAAAEEWIR